MRAKDKTVQQIARQRPTNDLPALLGETVQAFCEMLVSLTSTAPASAQASDKLLNVTEAARILDTSEDYLYRHKELPFVVRVRRRVKFSALGIEKYIANKKR